MLPLVDISVRVDMREQRTEIDLSPAPTADGLAISGRALLRWRVGNPTTFALFGLKGIVRGVSGWFEEYASERTLADVLGHRDKLGDELRASVESALGSAILLRDVSFPQIAAASAER